MPPRRREGSSSAWETSIRSPPLAYDRNRLEQLEERIRAIPRVTLAHLPTPLDRADRLSQALGGPRILIKREDATGLAVGGNKARMFEFVLADVVASGCEAVVASSAVQSNYLRQLAAACARLGLECHLVLKRVRGDKDNEVQGGLLLDLLLGANVRLSDCDWAELALEAEAEAERLRAQGKKVYLARSANTSGLGLYAVAYCEVFVELVRQLEERDLTIDRLWVASSDTTQAGLALANKFLGSPWRISGVSPFGEAIDTHTVMSEIASDAAEVLGLDTRVETHEIENFHQYAGAGYGMASPEANSALELVARSEGTLLDPVYTAKAMAGLIDKIQAGEVSESETVAFIHTGGTPAVFAYPDELELSALSSQLSQGEWVRLAEAPLPGEAKPRAGAP